MCLCFVKSKLCTGSPNCNGIYNHTIEIIYILYSGFPLSLSDNIYIYIYIYNFSTLAATYLENLSMLSQHLSSKGIFDIVCCH